jgi:hypothetical protein
MLSKFKSMDKLDKALVIARTICWIEYLAILPVFILINIYLAAIIVILLVFLCIPLWIAYDLMRFRLEEIKEPRITKLWATIAVIVAPFSIAFYIVSSVLVAEIFIRNLYDSGWIEFIFLNSGFIGFCMPFVLLTYWLKYRYRKDEF